MSVSSNTVYDILHNNGETITLEQVKNVIKNLSNTDYLDLSYAISDQNYEMIVYIVKGNL
jgi:hypothetical protein